MEIIIWKNNEAKRSTSNAPADCWCHQTKAKRTVFFESEGEPNGQIPHALTELHMKVRLSITYETLASQWHARISGLCVWGLHGMGCWHHVDYSYVVSGNIGWILMVRCYVLAFYTASGPVHVCICACPTVYRYLSLSWYHVFVLWRASERASERSVCIDNDDVWLNYMSLFDYYYFCLLACTV